MKKYLCNTGTRFISSKESPELSRVNDSFALYLYFVEIFLLLFSTIQHSHPLNKEYCSIIKWTVIKSAKKLETIYFIFRNCKGCCDVTIRIFYSGQVVFDSSIERLGRGF